MIARLLSSGTRYLFRGLRTGDVPLFAMGFVLAFAQRAKKRRKGKVTSLKLRAGQSAALRVTRPGAEPVTYLIEADRP